ncbi:hypothetical protein GXN76_07735 [Kroppenstedtia pulmonis]|uniref:Uncharacterized protein n=1 Tax=Kroppenstedtia pulmonis TaxID=1380685 RepID=A0A7D4CMI6_9BACL|nr:hypothetical protein [Kroppenstedtia pulmonis]QKG84378.1 hypothetical protein GXN76_07735 [Kroppenstedtia pulmonis]
MTQPMEGYPYGYYDPYAMNAFHAPIPYGVSGVDQFGGNMEPHGYLQDDQAHTNVFPFFGFPFFSPFFGFPFFRPFPFFRRPFW